jgi:glucan-binding YG repeat protein
MKLKFKNIVCSAALVLAMTATMPGLAYAAEISNTSAEATTLVGNSTTIAEPEDESGDAGDTDKWPGSDYSDYTGLLENPDDGVTYYLKDGEVLSYTGLYEECERVHYYLIDGALQKVSGMTEVMGENDGLYYLEEGKLVWTATGVIEDNDTVYYLTNGKFNEDANGIGWPGSAGYYLRNGIADTTFTGMAVNHIYEDQTIIWAYVKDGRCTNNPFVGFAKVDGKEGIYYVNTGKDVAGVIDFNTTGLTNVNGTWYYLKNDQVDTSYTNLVKYNGSWYYVKNGQIDWSCTTLAQVDGKGDWYYVKNGKLDWSYTGLAQVDGKGTYYYVQNGKINWKANGLVNANGGWYYLKNGKVDTSYSNLVNYKGSWYYVKNGKIDWSYSNLVKYGNIWYYVHNGKIDWNYTTLAQVNGKGSWYYVKNGKLDWSYTGLANYNGTWYYIQKGILNWNYSNLVKYGNDWYYVRNGKIDWNYTTLAQVDGKGSWYYVKNGRLDWSYTGLAQVDGKGAYYYVQNGRLNWNYSGLVNYGGTWYYIQKGVLKTNYSNLVKYGNDWYYVRNGKIDWNYTTLAQVNGKGDWYYVKNGKLDWSYTGLAKVAGQNTLYYVQNGKVNWNTNGMITGDDGSLYTIKNGVATKYVHEHTWVEEPETIHHDALTVWEQTFKCKCGYETTDVDEFNSHIENAEENALSYADTNASLAIEKLNEHGAVSSEGTTRTVAEAYDETVTIKKCSTCGETNENDGHEHQWVEDVQVVDHVAEYEEVTVDSCKCGWQSFNIDEIKAHDKQNTELETKYWNIGENHSISKALIQLHSSGGEWTWKKLISEPSRKTIVVGQKCSICGKTKNN